jgi:outer membrane protein OmpA-like peptidoglycan-associated protein
MTTDFSISAVRRFLTVGSCASVLLLGLTGCPGTGESQQAGQPSAEECAKAEAGAAAGDFQGTTALVVDNTASAAATGLPPTVEEMLKKAQQARHRLALVPVRGAGERAAVTRFIALNPRPDDDSQAGDAARRIVIGCVARWARAADMLPTAPGSAPVEALAAASREDPATIVVRSDGLSNAGDLNLDDIGFDADPAAVAAKLRAAGSLPASLSGKKIIWTGLGDSAKPLRPALLAALEQLWRQVLGAAGAEVTFNGRAGEPADPLDGLPADDVRLPDAAKVSWACGDSYTIPAAMLFAPDSADLGDRSDDVLRRLADALAEHPDWTAVISGHTADFGTAAGRQRLSEDRARAVAQALAGMGVVGSRLTSAGFGATRPAADEWAGAGHDLAAAARNRRVVVQLGTPGCPG